MTSSSLIVLAYNQERFVEEAVRSALSQDQTNLEIVISDDASTDRTFEIIRSLIADYRGPHRVIINRNPINLGIGAHLNRVMELVSGNLIIAMAGDDTSAPERCRIIVDTFETHPRAMVAYSDLIDVDEIGLPFGGQGQSRTYVAEPLLTAVRRWVPGPVGASMAWRRTLFERFGPLSSGVVAEDRVLAYRARLLGDIVHLRIPLVRYRQHAGSISRQPSIDPIRLRQSKDFWLVAGDAAYKNFLSDLDKLRTDEAATVGADELRQEIETQRNRLRVDLQALRGAGLLSKLCILMTALMDGLLSRSALQSFLLSELPRAYSFQLRIKRAFWAGR